MPRRFLQGQLCRTSGHCPRMNTPRRLHNPQGRVLAAACAGRRSRGCAVHVLRANCAGRHRCAAPLRAARKVCSRGRSETRTGGRGTRCGSERRRVCRGAAACARSRAAHSAACVARRRQPRRLEHRRRSAGVPPTLARRAVEEDAWTGCCGDRRRAAADRRRNARLFVAQMLNLDLLGGISFDKGCYTGQEIIARAHYRGRVKRACSAFAPQNPCRWPPGASGTTGGWPRFAHDVVTARPMAGSDLRAVRASHASDGRDDRARIAADARHARHDSAAHVTAGDRGPCLTRCRLRRRRDLEVDQFDLARRDRLRRGTERRRARTARHRLWPGAASCRSRSRRRESRLVAASSSHVCAPSSPPNPR